MKQVKTKGIACGSNPMPVLYSEMCERVRGCNTRLQYHAAFGNKAAMLAESRALLGQCSALVELLEADLREQGRVNV